MSEEEKEKKQEEKKDKKTEEEEVAEEKSAQDSSEEEEEKEEEEEEADEDEEKEKDEDEYANEFEKTRKISDDELSNIAQDTVISKDAKKPYKFNYIYIGFGAIIVIIFLVMFISLFVSGDTPSGRNLSEEDLRQVIAAHEEELRGCVDTWASSNPPSLNLELYMELNIDASGSATTNFNGPTQPPTLIDCLRNVVEQWRFPGGPASVTIPLIIQPPGSGGIPGPGGGGIPGSGSPGDKTNPNP